jgi:WD40 repeat protein
LLALLSCVVSVAASELSTDAKDDAEVRQFQHTRSIALVMFSPDGRMIVTDNQLWETATGRKMYPLPIATANSATGLRFWLAFSPDSRRLAIHEYRDIVFLELATGKVVWRVPQPPRNTSYREDVPRIAFTPDGKQLLSARNDEAQIRVWTVATGEEVRRFPYDSLKEAGMFGAHINSFGVSADGKWVVVHSTKAGRRSGPVLLELESGKELHRHRVGTEDDSVHFSVPSPDGQQLIYAKKNELVLLDLLTGKETRRFEGRGQYVFLVAVSPDGEQVAASIRAPGSDRDWVQCWKVATGESLRVFKGHQGTITSLVFSPDGKYILSGSTDRTARLWRVKE